jgi:hypothetical protein
VAAPAARPERPSIQVTSTPPGAAISVDGKPTGQVTPATVALQAGQTYDVRLSLAHFEAWVGEATPGKTTELAATLAPLATVQVTSEPAGAEVRVGGAVVVPTTPGTFEAAAGTVVHVDVQKDGFLPEVVQRTVSGAELTVAVKLKPAAYLNVSSVPSHAKLFLDGAPTGQDTPVEHFAVAPGTAHEVEVRLGSLGAPAEKVRPLAKGAVRTLSFTLEDGAARARRAVNVKVQAKIDALEKELKRQEALADSYFLKNPTKEIAARQRIEDLEAQIQELEAQLDEAPEADAPAGDAPP